MTTTMPFETAPIDDLQTIKGISFPAHITVYLREGNDGVPLKIIDPGALTDG